MPTTFRPCRPEQSLLFPPSPRDWLPEGHLAFFIADTVATLDLRAFYEPYEGDGRRNQPFDPQMMVTVLVYAYATGTFSSRRIAQKLEEDVAYRLLAAGNFPAHRTIAEFRQQHLATFEALFVQVVRIARETGMVQLGTLAVDGSKVNANASKHKAMSYGRMRDEERRLREQIAALTAQADAVDAAEDAQHGADVRGDELPAELQRRETRLAKIAAAKARLEARQAEADRQKGRRPDDGRKSRGRKPFKREFGVPPDDAQDNFTDPESRIMKASHGFDQCYNGQVAVDAGSQLILATGLTNCAADNGELLHSSIASTSPLGRIRPPSWAMPGIAAKRRFRRWRPEASPATFHWAMNPDRRSPRTRLISRPSAWPPDWQPRPAVHDIVDARRSSSPFSGGSKACSGSVASVSVAWQRPAASGISSVSLPT